ncbi:MAG: hypothetical protein EP335_10380 [Alphaproteobacteria bacterium]|nr:MAG: hypothetical protein EP335_10380 [Alphaproteobacteria bacterium]
MKRLYGGVARPLVLAAGLSLGLAGTGAYAWAAADDETAAPAAPETPAAPKLRHKKVVVVSSDDDNVFVEKDGKIIISNGHVPANIARMDAARAERDRALEQARAALDQVSERLKKSRSKDDRAAFELAQKGLTDAIAALEAVPSVMAFGGMPHGSFHFSGDIDGEDLKDALTELRIQEGEIKGFRFELNRELAQARAEIAEALADIDIEVNGDGDLTELRIRGLKDARRQLEGMDEQRLEALKRAEEDLARARADLERKIEERKAREAEAKAPESDGR